MRKTSLLLAVLLLHALLALSQTHKISGQIKDEKGNPVPFASIRIKGHGSGVAADANGAFTIEVPNNATLLISAAGFESLETKPGNGPSLDISLHGQDNLSEVVVTALGIRRTKNDLPYAAQQVTAAEITKTR